MAAKCANPGSQAIPLKPRTEDLMFVLRDEPKKLARVEELLYMNEVLERARKVDLFDGSEDVIPGSKSMAPKI